MTDTETSTSRPNEKLNTVGVLLAVVVSFIALLHTIDSDRKLRECEFLYSKNERLFELKIKINEINDSLSILREQGRDLIGGGDEDAMRDMIGEFISTQIVNAQDLYRLFDINKYAFSHDDVERIQGLFRNLERISEDHMSLEEDIQPEKFLYDVFDQSSNLVGDVKSVSDRELTIVADRLRDACSA